MSTQKNLEDAFAGESQANRRYLAFAKKADADGYPAVARLFRAAADAETIHAHAHLRAMEGIQDTVKNLEVAVAGEAYEFQSMYPEFLAAAESEGHKRAEISFRNALAVEETHHGLYVEALEAVKADRDLPARNIHVCPVCGHTHYDEAPERCPVCNAPRDKFFEVA